MVISIEIMFFQVRENLKNISKTNIILTFFTLTKKSPRDFAFFFFTRRGREGPGRKSCRSSAVVLTKALVRVELSSANFWCKIRLRLLNKTCSTSAVPLILLTKPIVRLACRCSCEMCRTSAVPLLVIHLSTVKPS